MNSNINNNGDRQPFRIPRSISEQESILAHQGSILPSNLEELPNEMRDLMDLRARGIFNDRDITDLLDAIRRTQEALAASNEKFKKSYEDRDRNPTLQAQLSPPLKLSDMTVKNKNTKTASTGPKSENIPKTKLAGDRKSNTERKLSNPNAPATNQTKPLKQSTVNGLKTPKKPVASEVKTAKASVSTGAANPQKTLSVIQARAGIVRSIEEVKSIISSMTAENIKSAKKQLSSSVNQALESLSAAPESLKKEFPPYLSHSLKQIRLASASLDPYDIDQMKEIISRHVGDAEKVAIPSPPPKKPTKPKSLAGKIVEYAAQDPTGANLAPPEAADEAKSSKNSPTEKPKRSTKVSKDIQSDMTKDGPPRKSPDNLTKNPPDLLRKNSKDKKMNAKSSRASTKPTHDTTSTTASKLVNSPREQPKLPENSSERLAKATIVRCLERAKTNVSVVKAQNLDIVKEGICKLMNEAINAMLSLQGSMNSKNKKALKWRLERAKYLSATMTVENLGELAPELNTKLDEALSIVMPSVSATLSKSSRRKGLAKQIINYVEKNPLELENIESTNLTNEVNVVPPVCGSGTTMVKLEDAINSIRGDCTNKNLVLLVCPLQKISKNGECNLRITAVDRKKAKINGNFVMPECNFISLTESGAFAKYYTVRVSLVLESVEKQLEHILRYINQKADLPKKKGSATQRSVFLKPPLHEHVPAVTSAAIRRSITISPREGAKQCDVEPKIDLEPTIAELLVILQAGVGTKKDLELFFDLMEKHKFLIYAHPDFRDERCIYMCEVFTSSNEYMGRTKLRGEDILEYLQQRPCIVKNFEFIVDITDVVFPAKVKETLSNVFQKMGLLYLYDAVGMFIFNIYKKWRLRRSKA